MIRITLLRCSGLVLGLFLMAQVGLAQDEAPPPPPADEPEVMMDEEPEADVLQMPEAPQPDAPETTTPPAAPATSPVATPEAPIMPLTATPEPEPAPALPPLPAPTGDNIIFNFRDASLDTVLEYLSQAAGLAILRDTTVQGRFSVISRQPMNVVEAINVLNSVLKDKGYTAVQNGKILRIMTLADAKKTTVPVRSGSDPAAIIPSERIVTQIIPIRFVDAVRLKQDLAPLIPAYADLTANAASNTLILTDTESNIRHVVEIIRAIDSSVATELEVKVYSLKYANATTAARLITDIFREQAATRTQGGATTGRFTFPGGGGGRGGQPAAAADSGAGGSPRSQRVTASADDRTNTLVVSAASDVLMVVDRVVKELDSDPSQDQAVIVYSVKSGRADNIAAVLNSLVGGTSRTGTGTATRAGTGNTTRAGTGNTTRTGTGNTTRTGTGTGGR